MLISETESEECGPVILDLDTVAQKHVCHKGVFFPIPSRLKISKKTCAFGRDLFSRFLQPSSL